MKYRKAEQILPEELIVMIQEYVNGEYLYIPCKKECKKIWGEKSGSRRQLDVRNQEIFIRYKKGYSVEEIANFYFLSKKSIYKIIAKFKKNIK